MSTTDHLSELRPDQLQKRMRESEAKIARLESRPDPGKGLKPREANAARETHLRDLERAHREEAELRAAWRAGDPKEVHRRTISDRLFRRAQRQAAVELRRAIRTERS